MTTTDQILLAITVALTTCIISLCWALQQANYRLDELELEMYGEDIEPPEEIASCSGYIVVDQVQAEQT